MHNIVSLSVLGVTVGVRLLVRMDGTRVQSSMITLILRGSLSLVDCWVFST